VIVVISAMARNYSHSVKLLTNDLFYKHLTLNYMSDKDSLISRNGVSYLVPFILVTSCFALWGFANDITNPMVKAFSKIFRMSVTDGALVQVAFYGGYFAMAFPAAMFIRRFSYKAGVLMGLGLYAVGALLFLPASWTGMYYPFLVAYFILTCGLSFLETSCNPYILTMGSEETATRRLNMAQCFNPMGSLCGMYVAMNFIQAKLNPASTDERALLSDAEFSAMRDSDLSVLIAPYLAIGAVIAVMFAVIYFTNMPKNGDQNHDINFMPTLKRIFSIDYYREGVIAQFFYVGVQIMCWTFIIQYGTRVLMNEGMGEQEAEVTSQTYNIVAMAIFVSSRFICTYFLKFINAGALLGILAVVGALLTCGVIFIDGRAGLYCLVAISACMSLMFPTIYGIALQGLGDDAKFGAAGLIMAILGGSVLPPLQASIIDQKEMFGMPAVNVSFVLPLLCFLVIIIYGYRTYLRTK
jgi:FHS family L-fucose permease-like MFS transporter